MKPYDEMNFEERVAWVKGQIVLAIGRGEDINRVISLALICEADAARRLKKNK